MIYKAIGDFSDLIKDAAAARAAMADLGKSAQAQGQAEVDAANKAAVAREKDIQSMNRQRQAMDQLAQSAKAANQQTLYGGRNDMGQHLADLSQEERWQELLLRQRNLGFTSPQAAYSWRQMELQQAYLMNRARFGATSSGTGFTTPNEYLAYLQREVTAETALNQALLSRAATYKANADAALSYASALRGHNETFGTMGAASSQQLAGIQQFQAALVGLPDTVTTQLNIDDSAALSKLAVYQSILRGVPTNVKTTDVITAAYAAGGVNIPSALPKETIPVELSGPYENQLSDLMNTLVQLSRDRVSIPVSFALPDRQQVQGFVGGLPAVGATGRVPMTGGANSSAGPPQSAAAAYNSLATAMAGAGGAGRGASGGIKAAGDAADSSGNSAFRARGWWSLLGKEVQLFGGILPGMLGHIALWHILLDGIIEALAVLIPAAVALSAWAYAAAPAFEGIATHLYSIWVVSKALNTSIPPLTNNFQKFQDAAKPQALELYGEAIDVMNSKSGALGEVALKTGNIVDQLGARISVALQAPGTGKFLEAASKDFAVFGDFIGNIFGIVGNFLKVMPGYAEKLLGILDGVSHAIESITGSGLGSWLLGIGLTFHGALVWGGLFGTALLGILPTLARLTGGIRDVETGAKIAKDTFSDVHGIERYKTSILSLGTNLGSIGMGIAGAAKAVVNFIPNLARMGGAAEDAGKGVKLAAAGSELWGTALTGLEMIPVWGWVAIGVVALGALLVAFGRSKDATDKWIDSMDKAVESATNWSAIPTTFNAVVQSQQKLASSSAQLGQELQKNHEHTVAVVKDYQGMGTAAGNQAADLDNLNAANQRYKTQLNAQVTLLDDVSRKFGVSYPQALAAAGIAGVNLSKVTNTNSEAFAIARERINGLLTGYENLGQKGATLNNDVQAVSLGIELQQTQVDKLNSAWDNFLGVVTGGESTFGKLGADLNTLAKDLGTTGASFDGINKASITLRTGFEGTITDAGKMLDAFRVQAAVMGNADEAQKLLTRGGKDLIATLIPVAGKSKEVRDQVFALAQAAGYDGVNSLKALTQWSGKQGATKAEEDLSKVTGILTGDVSDLAKDYQNLANVLATDVNQMMADSILKADKAQTAFLDFAQGIKQGTTGSQKFKDAADAVISVLLQQSGNNLPKAKSAFEAYMIQLGQTKDEADKLWNSLSGKVSVELVNESAKTLPGVQKAFQTFATQGLNDTQTQADNLWKEITNKLGPQLGGLGDLASGPAKKKFIDWAENGLGLTQQKANALWQELVILQGHIDALHGKDITIHMDGSGLYTVTGSIIAASQGKGGSGNAAGGLAFGGYIDQGTTPKADDVTVRVSKGEYVVQADAVDQYGLAFMDALNQKKLAQRQLMGFANGGSASQAYNGSSPAALYPMPSDMDNAETTLMLNAEVSEMRNAIKTAKAATQKMIAAAGNIGNYHPGAGVDQWRNATLTALGLAGSPASLADAVLYQMQTESGGDPRAVNLWDSNAAAGHPSVGLMQVIAGTYAAYGAPREGYPPPVQYGVSEAPVANIYAAIKYAQVAYGPGLRNIRGGIGSGHGYAAGGMVGAENPPPEAAFASGGSANWNFPAPTGLHAYDVTDKGFRLGWSAVKGPKGQKPASYTVETFQLNDKLVDKFVAHATNTSEYGLGGHGLHPGWSYRTLVWANGGPQAPPHATMLTPLQKQKTVGGLPVISTTAQDAYQTWFGDYQVLDRDVHQEIAALWALNALTGVGKSGGPTKDQAATWGRELKALQAKQRQVIGLGLKPPGYYGKVHDYYTHPQDLPTGLWNQFTSGVSQLEKQQAGYPLGFRFEPDRSKALHNQLLRLEADAKILGTAWKGTFGAGKLTPGAHSPPPSQPLGGGLIDILPLIQGGPATPVFGMGSPDMGFAGGGTIHPFMQGYANGGPVGLQQVAAMFGGLMPTTMLMPTVTPGGISDAYLSRMSNMPGAGQDFPRKLSQAGAAHKAAFNVEQLNINNPVAETPSLSIARAANRLAFLAGRGES